MFRKLAIAVMAAGVSSFALAQTQSAPESPQQTQSDQQETTHPFANLDTDQNRYLSIEEIDAYKDDQDFTSRWRDYDTNKDDRLGYGEYRRYYADRAYSSYDTDQDDYISQEEADTFPDLVNRWDGADVDSDNRISRDEFARFDEEMSYRELDVDQDNYISREEAEANPDLVNMWDGADVDRDNRLSMDELANRPDQ